MSQVKPSDRNFGGLAKLRAQIVDQLHRTPLPKWRPDRCGTSQCCRVGAGPPIDLIEANTTPSFPVESSWCSIEILRFSNFLPERLQANVKGRGTFWRICTRRLEALMSCSNFVGNSPAATLSWIASARWKSSVRNYLGTQSNSSTCNRPHIVSGIGCSDLSSSSNPSVLATQKNYSVI